MSKLAKIIAVVALLIGGASAVAPTPAEAQRGWHGGGWHGGGWRGGGWRGGGWGLGRMGAWLRRWLRPGCSSRVRRISLLWRLLRRSVLLRRRSVLCGLLRRWS